jgi:hypothetical protein
VELECDRQASRRVALAKDAPESTKGFLLNHLISDVTPKGDYANADPVTGQAAWFDLRVRSARARHVGESEPQFPPLRVREADERTAALRRACATANIPARARPNEP